MTSRPITAQHLLPFPVLGALASLLACQGPDRGSFPEDPATSAATGTTTTGASPTSSGSTASTSSSNDGGGGSGADGGNGPVGPGGGDGGGPGPGPGSGGGGEGPGSGGSGGGSGGAGPGCGVLSDGVCVPPPPGGWGGPYTVMERTTGIPTPSCVTTNYPEQLAAYIGEIDDGAATCDCECVAAGDTQCGNPATICYDDDLNECMQTCGTQQSLPIFSCQALTSGLKYAGAIFPPPMVPGHCNPSPTDDIEEPTWALEIVACTGATNPEGECDAGTTCVAVPGEDTGDLCIIHSGDVECPADVFTEKRLRYSGVTDERSCTTCTCGDTEIDCGYIDFTSDQCDQGLTATVTPGTCADIRPGAPNNAIRAFYVPTPQAPATCPPNGGDLDGEVEHEGETTVCCVP